MLPGFKKGGGGKREGYVVIKGQHELFLVEIFCIITVSIAYPGDDVRI